ncbi:MAG TPA: hypothetical protein PK152_19915 [Anaerolineales bacterium]|nr:hypothetical protein [Anaerolineales bacterium]
MPQTPEEIALERIKQAAESGAETIAGLKPPAQNLEAPTGLAQSARRASTP